MKHPEQTANFCGFRTFDGIHRFAAYRPLCGMTAPRTCELTPSTISRYLAKAEAGQSAVRTSAATISLSSSRTQKRWCCRSPLKTVPGRCRTVRASVLGHHQSSSGTAAELCSRKVFILMCRIRSSYGRAKWGENFAKFNHTHTYHQSSERGTRRSSSELMQAQVFARYRISPNLQPARTTYLESLGLDKRKPGNTDGTVWKNLLPVASGVLLARPLTRTLSVVGLCSAGAATALCWMASHGTGLSQFDVPVARWSASIDSSALVNAARYVTVLGSTAGVIPVGLVVAALERRRGLGGGVVGFFVLAIGAQAVVVNVIKVTIGRDRPALASLVPTASSSFPSAHSTAAAVTYLCSAVLLSRKRGTSIQFALFSAAIVVSGIVAGTRVLLGVHWLTDVSAGSALGGALACLCSWLFRYQLGFSSRSD
jgi:membrane-associated phospholipid phosphatase